MVNITAYDPILKTLAVYVDLVWFGLVMIVCWPGYGVMCKG